MLVISYYEYLQKWLLENAGPYDIQTFSFRFRFNYRLFMREFVCVSARDRHILFDVKPFDEKKKPFCCG